MKTLDQIWEENFDTVAAGEYEGSDCGNQVGGGSEPNSCPPLSTLADKFLDKLMDPVISNSKKTQALDQIVKDYNTPPKKTPEGVGHGVLKETSPQEAYHNMTGSERDAFNSRQVPGGGPVRGAGNSDRNSGPLPPSQGTIFGPNIPESPQIDLGGVEMKFPFGDGSDGSDPFGPVEFNAIKPDGIAVGKSLLGTVAAIAKAACADDKPAGDGNADDINTDLTPDGLKPTSTSDLLNKTGDPLSPSFHGRPFTAPQGRPSAGAIQRKQ